MRHISVAVYLVLLLPLSSFASDCFVNVANPTPLAPYTNWATAATVIQDAIDAAPTGGVVWVTNGVYATGGEPANLGTTLTNRARVNKSIALKSVNGPSVTSIVGYGPGSTNGPGAVRCVWLGSGSSVEGFTLTNGFTLVAGDYGAERSGGGAWCADDSRMVSNCVLVGNRANMNAAGVQSGTIVDCIFRENQAKRDGGAMSGGTALRCTLIQNVANRGAGAAYATLIDSTVLSNRTQFLADNIQHGGGLLRCTATACDIVGNQAAILGGGSCSSVLHRCTLRGNRANTGAGAYGDAADNSVFFENIAGVEAGGAYGGTMTNCTVAGNRGPVAGGVIGVAAVNSIVWDNRLDNGITVSNHVGGGFSYSCTHPLPAGTGNLNADPVFADAAGGDFRLAGGSPCLEAGFTPAAVGALDRAGGLRLNGAIDMGAYEGTEPPELAYLAVSTDPAGAGTVTGAGTNHVGAWVSIGATPTSGWVFVDWHDGVTTNPRSVRVPSGGTSYVARFRAVVSVPLTLTADPPEGGTVTGGGMYLEGTAVDIGAAALPGWYFDRWSDGITNAARTVQVPVGGTALTAQFLPGPVSLDVRADPVEAGTVTGAGMYFIGTWVSIGATPTSGWVFVDWNDGVTTNPRSVLVPSGGTSYVARFRAAVMVPLTLTADPPEGGTVTGGGMYLEGTAVDIGAAALPGWYFDRWSDGVTNAARTVQVPVGGTALTAQFQPVSTPQHYVSPFGSHAPPFATWSTAATNIQAAIDVAAAGDTVLVTNGVYATGGRPVVGFMTNRVTIDRAIAVRSVNGPAATLIVGNGAPGGGHGVGAVRCAWVGVGASLQGFTLTNGHTLATGAYAVERSGGGAYCEWTGSVLSNCLLAGNSANINAGGVQYGTLFDCVLSNNVASSDGGAGAGITAVRCRIRDNSAAKGAGIAYSAAINCLVAGNVASSQGGGAYSGTLTNCTVISNRAPSGGGSRDASAVNSILWGNTLIGGTNASNYEGGSLAWCCSSPLPSGTGNTAEDPRFVGVGDFHILPGSPCIDAGDPLGAPTVDIEGDTRPVGAAPDIGCDETGPGTGSGPITAAAIASLAEVVPGFAPEFVSYASGAAWQLEWVFDDGFRATNQPAIRRAFATAGSREVLLIATGASGTATGRTTIVVTDGTYFVSPSGNDEAPGTNWATAKATIQAAVDACTLPGATVWVTNGVYAAGGRAAVGVMTNRVTIDRSIAVRSVNGPEASLIVGSPAPGGDVGEGAVRCVWLGSGASLHGFTLTNGFTQSAGDEVAQRSGGGAWGQSTDAVLSNCVVRGNRAYTYGAGVYGGTAFDCRIEGNRVNDYGGGAAYGVLRTCTLSNNVSGSRGGATYSAVLEDCLVVGNQAAIGAGAHGGSLDRCVVRDNRSSGTGATGGGLASASARNTVLVRNTTTGDGGGAYASVMSNCTVIANTSAGWGGGVRSSTLINSIVYYNSGPASLTNENHDGGTFTFSCTTPTPPGAGNTSADPLLVGIGDFHVLPGSPCIDAADPLAAPAVDLEGDPRPQGAAPDIGCDETGAATGSGTVAAAAYASPTNGFTDTAIDFTSFASGPALQIEWIFDDGVRVTNRPKVSHVFAAAGAHEAWLLATGAEGMATARVAVAVLGMECYVSPAGSDSADGASWATAKATIQAAVDSCTRTGMTVWVTNGVYAAGGRAVTGVMTNRVTLDQLVAVRSVNGPAVTHIVGTPAPGTTNPGPGAVRCAWVGTGATLQGFTLTNGFTQSAGDENYDRSGGGALCQSPQAIVSNCVVVGNRAHAHGGGVHWGRVEESVIRGNRAASGAGVWDNVAVNCFLFGNSASSYGGAAWGNTMTNCTVVGNDAPSSGGISSVNAVGCILWGNVLTGTTNLSNHSGGSLTFTCSQPMPSGTGNISSDPLLVGRGDFHILPGSFCIDAADPLATSAVDIEGDPRPQGAARDIGCDETGPGTGVGHVTASAMASPAIGLAGLAVDFVSLASGPAIQLEWVFEDGMRFTNQTTVSHGFGTAGIHEARLLVTGPEGVSTTLVSVLVAGLDRFVTPTGNDAADGTSWATAKATIQAGVDACTWPGMTVWVSNGVYAAGGRAVVGTMTNRLVLDRPVTVIGVGGARSTVILGQASPQGGGTGDGAIRCVWMTNGTTLLGFTLSNGFTRATNVVSRGVTNSVPEQDCGGAVWCATPSCVVSQCVIEGNAAHADGGGALGGTLAECVVRFNTAQRGGGIASNTAANCLIARNVASGDGGGALAAGLTHCSVLANRAATAGGMWGGAATNSIVYFNEAGREENHSSVSFVASCTRPLPPGPGNLAVDPGLGGVANPWLSAGSPCIDAGLTPLSIGALDLNGEPRLQGAAVDIGCDESAPSAPTNAPLASILAPWTELATDYGMDFQADTWGQVSFLGWDFGDGAVTSGVAGVTHAFAEPGTYEVRLVASNLAGVATSVMTVRVERAERFVAPTGDDLAPGTNWATAKATIQGGVDASTLPGTYVRVTNGVYAAGGRPAGASMTNRVAIDRPVRVTSVGGPAETFIVGARSPGAADGCSTDSVRCVWMTNGAWIAGFTLTNGFSSADVVNTNERSGGGVWCENRSAVLSNCVIRNCGARFSGGGVFLGSLADCEISECAATNGGGAVEARLDGCLVWSNRADYGAGAYASDSSNSVFRWNVARIQGGGVRGGLHEGGQISGNAATNGGGAYAGILRSCVVADNIAGSMGGGAHSCTQELCLVARNVAGAGGGAYHGLLYNCALVGNRAATNGGGARSLLLANCTVIGNRAAVGPGTYTSTQLNSIVYFNGTTNGAREEYSGGVFEYSCTTPMPPGAGNITNAPMLAGVDNPRLLQGSPCIDAGTNGYVWGGTDLYGEVRVAGGSVDIGCDEFAPGPRTGTVAVSLSADWTGWAAGAPGGFAASTTGAVGMLIWDFGDGMLVTNETAPGHAFGAPGTYDVRVIARSDDAASTGVVQVVIGLSPLFVAPWGDDGWPGTNWATAKATIQAAVDASDLAGTVLVTGGVYTAGGRVMEGTLSNRVAIPRRMIVRSVDGPESTFIVGIASPTNNGLGAEAVRCAWLTNDAVLAGFTLTNGFTRYLNLPDATRSPEEIGGGVWCMSGSAVISNCVLVGNGASRGGGAYNGAVVDCEVRSNSAAFNGGGAYYCAATGSLFEGNSAQQYGGAADRGSLERCRVVANRSSLRGGGASTATIRRSTIVGNSAAFEGGGGYNVTAVNCYFYGNSASTGGGVRSGTLTGCTVAGNEATQIAGGASGSTLRNTICFYNGPRGNHSTLTAVSSHNCTTPMPPGAGNVTNEPMLAGFGNPHILPGSPCIDAGTNAASMSALDIDGEARTNGAAVDIGCDEFWLEGCTGAVGVALSASWTNVAPGYPVAVNLLTEGRITGLAFTHESGVMLTSSSPSYGLLFPGPGVYSMTATATNHDSVAAAKIDILVSTQAFHVAPFGSDAAAGTNWATAKATLQAAVDDYPVLGGTVWVTNGVYDTGGRVISGLQSNRVALPRPVTVRSVNGAGATFIVGLSGPTNGLPGTGAVRCVWMGNGGTLSGFTLTNGSTGVSGDGIVDRSGGGAWCSPGAVIERCRIVQCSATERGGGVYSGNLRSSVLFGNYSGYDGGGAHSSVLLGCSVASNRARYLAGGVYGSTVTSSIVYFNSANTPNYHSTTLDGSCSLPFQVGIVTTADPGFRNVAEGDLTLSNGSPCINAGLSEPWMGGEVDFAGNPRVIGGTVDMGAYEFTGGATASGIPWQWLLDHDLATDGTADGEDVDGDGQNAYAEQRAGTHPWDPLSALGMGSAAAADLGDGIFPIFRWSSVSGRVYRVGLSTNLMVGFDATVADDVPATPPENTVTDRTDAAASFKVYRVEVK